MSNVNAVSFTIFVVLFLVVTAVGFVAARWRRAEDRLHLNEWGLGGRGFGTAKRTRQVDSCWALVAPS